MTGKGLAVETIDEIGWKVTSPDGQFAVLLFLKERWRLGFSAESRRRRRIGS
jgi:hypothetical protein